MVAMPDGTSDRSSFFISVTLIIWIDWRTGQRNRGAGSC
jgi:hypothetical protein